MSRKSKIAPRGGLQSVRGAIMLCGPKQLQVTGYRISADRFEPTIQSRHVGVAASGIEDRGWADNREAEASPHKRPVLTSRPSEGEFVVIGDGRHGRVATHRASRVAIREAQRPACRTRLHGGKLQPSPRFVRWWRTQPVERRAAVTSRPRAPVMRRAVSSAYVVLPTEGKPPPIPVIRTSVRIAGVGCTVPNARSGKGKDQQPKVKPNSKHSPERGHHQCPSMSPFSSKSGLCDAT